MYLIAHSRTRAFSLVELSIVLVILGLLVGGVLAGQSLIRAAELRSVSTEYTRYIAAVRSFRDKYFAIPGDMPNATAFWGTAASCPGDNTTPSTGAPTCNGNGNGELSQLNGNEYFRFWHHLSNAGLIEATYTGVSDLNNPTSAVSTPGFNVPRSRISNAGWSVLYTASYDVTSTLYFDGNYGNFLVAGTAYPGGATRNPYLRPEESWNIDTKLDDGKPATGKIVTYEGQAVAGVNGCSTPVASAVATMAGSEYALSNNRINCATIFRGDF